MTMIVGDPPKAEDVDAAAAAFSHVQEYLGTHPDADMIRLRIDDEDGDNLLAVPRAVLELLVQILGNAAIGQGVSVVPVRAELTTQQAADLLNVSRPFLIGLLEAGQIDYRLVGKHRRVLARSLLDYKRADDASRNQDADALAAEAFELGFSGSKRRRSV